MGHMKDIDIRIRNGGNDAIAAACELAGIAKERRAAGGEAMNDIVTRLRDWRNVHLARLHLLMEEAADQIARLRSDNSRRANLETGLRDGIERLRLTDVERAAVQRAVKDESDLGLVYTADVLQSLLERLSGGGDFPVPDNAANADNTPATHATPSEGSEQSVCTLTAEEREAIEGAIAANKGGGHYERYE